MWEETWYQTRDDHVNHLNRELCCFTFAVFPWAASMAFIRAAAAAADTLASGLDCGGGETEPEVV